MQVQRKFLWLLAALVLLAGCAQFGLFQPKSFDHWWAYGMAGVSGTRQAAIAATGKELSKADAEEVLVLCNQARAILDSADKLQKTDLKTAEAKLALAADVIEKARAYLTRRGVKLQPVTVPKGA